MDRLEKSGKTLGDLSSEWQNRLIAVTGEPVFARLREQPIEEIEQGVREEVMDVIAGLPEPALPRIAFIKYF